MDNVQRSYIEGEAMIIYDSCQSVVQSCLDTRTFAVARLYDNEEKTDVPAQGCYGVYFCVSGRKQLFMDDQVYAFQPGDIIFIDPFESHSLYRAGKEINEWVVLSIYPDYLRQLSTPQTDLLQCFTGSDTTYRCKLGLSVEERRRFLYFVHRLSEDGGFGQDVLDQAVFMELMIFLNQIFLSMPEQALTLDSVKTVRENYHAEIDEVLSYINQHLAEELSISILASCFYLSSSYLCKLFKDTTGTTINRYITARRISQAKVLLADGHSVADTSDLCGFGDYSNFLKAFTKIVGISPKKYASYTQK